MVLTFMDHQRMGALLCKHAEPTTTLGTKALGKPPACPPAPAIRNAILQATGLAFNAIPITPEALFRAQEGGKADV